MEGRPIWDRGNSCGLYLKTSIAASSAGKGELDCACTGPFELRLDGQPIARRRGGALTERPLVHRIPFQLRGPGRHTLTVRAANRPAVAAPWFACSGAGVSPTAGGGTWTVRAAPQHLEDSGVDEFHDAREDPEGGDTDDTGNGWEPAVEVEAVIPASVREPGGILEEPREAVTIAAAGEWSGESPEPERLQALADCKCVHPQGLLSGRVARTIVRTAPRKSVVIQLDLGGIANGCPEVRLEAEESGGIIDLYFGYVRGSTHAQVRYIARAGRQGWRALQEQAGRYLTVRLSGFAENCHLESVSVVTRSDPGPGATATMEQDGMVAPYLVGRRTLDSVRQEIYSLQHPPRPYDWLAMLTAFATDFYLTGNTATARTVLRTAAGREGNRGRQSSWPGFPLFVEAYYLFSGDAETVSGLLSDLLPPGEANPSDSSAGTPTAEAGLAAASAAAAGRVCRSLGNTGAAATCQEEAGRLRELVQRRWREPEGLFPESAVEGGRFSQWANALVLYGSLARADQKERIAAAIGDPVLSPVEGLVQAWFLCEGLWRSGDEQRALEYARKHWERMAARPGATWADRALRPSAPYEPGPEHMVGAHLLGVEPLRPGFAVSRIRPPRGVATSASGSVPTPAGDIAVSWNREADGFEVETELPASIEGRLVLHRGGRKLPTILVNEITVWRNEKMYPNPFVQRIVADEEEIVLALTQGGRSRVEIV